MLVLVAVGVTALLGWPWALIAVAGLLLADLVSDLILSRRE